jgi:D-galactarolactone isomerase
MSAGLRRKAVYGSGCAETAKALGLQPSTYGTENAPTLDALVAFGPSARAVVVVDTTVTDAELKRMHNLGARGIRFN